MKFSRLSWVIHCQTVLAFWLGMTFESFSSNVLVATSQAVGMLGSLCWGGFALYQKMLHTVCLSASGCVTVAAMVLQSCVNVWRFALQLWQAIANWYCCNPGLWSTAFCESIAKPLLQYRVAHRIVGEEPITIQNRCWALRNYRFEQVCEVHGFSGVCCTLTISVCKSKPAKIPLGNCNDIFCQIKTSKQNQNWQICFDVCVKRGLLQIARRFQMCLCSAKRMSKKLHKLQAYKIEIRHFRHFVESWKLGKLKNSKLRLAKEKFQSLKYARKFWNFESFIFWFFVYSCHTCRSFKLNCRHTDSREGGPLELMLALVLFIAPFCSCSSLWFNAELWTVHHATLQFSLLHSHSLECKGSALAL